MIAKALVDHPEDVEVRSVEGQQVIVLELCVHPEDVGRVIGRHGRTAEALRTIFGAAGMKLQKHVMVEIIEKQICQFNGKVVRPKKVEALGIRVSARCFSKSMAANPLQCIAAPLLAISQGSKGSLRFQ